MAEMPRLAFGDVSTVVMILSRIIGSVSLGSTVISRLADIFAGVLNIIFWASVLPLPHDSSRG
jgi:hypothetical protein